MKTAAKTRAEKKIIPGKLMRIAPDFFSMHINPRDIRVISDPIDFISFEGMSTEQTRRITLLDEAKNRSFRNEAQRTIESAVVHERYSWEVLRIEENGNVTKE
jgi:predicted Holliday junction resolvase-like endonuclease